MADRQRCLVPFCHRTRRDDGRFGEWICPVHWRAVPTRLKAIYRRARRAEALAFSADREAYEQLVETPEWHLLPETAPFVRNRLMAAWTVALAMSRSRRLWRVCRRKAIETAGGIA